LAIHALRWIEQGGGHWNGQVPIRRLSRLEGLLAHPDSAEELEVTLDFLRREDDWPVVRGHVVGRMDLICQRCLGALEWAIDHRFELGLVRDEAGLESLPDDLDPLLLQDGQIDPWAVVEEELLLTMPMAPRHGEGECSTVSAGAPVLAVN